MDLSNFNTSKVIDMEWMFDGCSKLKKINGLNNFNTLNVTNMRSMFEKCSELEHLDLSNFNTFKVTNMENMFNQCHELKKIEGIHNFKTENVVSIRAMFRDCNALKSLDLSNFNTVKVMNMSKIFENCFELRYLDLSNFNTKIVIDMSYMFSRCYKLKEIKGIENFVSDKVITTEGMFLECPYNPLKPPEPPSKVNKTIITVYFTEGSQDFINFPLSCYNTDIFSILEEKLINEKPELKHKSLYFLSGGKVIETSLTLEQNKIKDKDLIIIYENE